MSDFYQNGVVTVLHRLGQPNVDQLEREMARFGDSINDAPLLAMVDYPILVQKPDGASDPDIHFSGMIRAPGIGPVEWNEAVLDLLAQMP